MHQKGSLWRARESRLLLPWKTPGIDSGCGTVGRLELLIFAFAPPLQASFADIYHMQGWLLLVRGFLLFPKNEIDCTFGSEL